MLPAVEPINSQFGKRAIYQVVFCEEDDERLTNAFWFSALASEEIDSTEVDVVCILVFSNQKLKLLFLERWKQMNVRLRVTGKVRL